MTLRSGKSTRQRALSLFFPVLLWKAQKLNPLFCSGLVNGVASKVAVVETPAPSSSSRPPPSVTDTEDTVVATDVTSTPQKGRKRSREEDAPERAVRPRDTSYEPPQGENPGFVGWIADSIKKFFRDFREGLAG